MSSSPQRIGSVSPTQMRSRECSPKGTIMRGKRSHAYTLGTNSRQRQIYENLTKIVPSPFPGLKEPQGVNVYSEVTEKEALYPLIDAHEVIMVAGAFFGDEGKGKTIDAIAHHPRCNIIARVNSGENAGHTVFDSKGNKFVFHLAPSGLLLENKRNLIGPECVMDPVTFLEEIDQLTRIGYDYADRLFVGNVQIVTPYHKLLDLLTSSENASTLKGMSPSHASKVTKRGLRLDHIFGEEEVIRSRLSRDLETYFGVLKLRNLTDEDVVKRCLDENADGVQRVPKHCVDFAKSPDKVTFLVNLYEKVVKNNPKFPKRIDVPHEIRRAIANGEKVLLEGPQSYWLSNSREKFWESTTSADTTASGLVSASQFNFQRCRTVVINVHKTPGTSRVGIGANPSGYVPQDYFSAQGIRTLNDLPKDMCVNFDAIQAAWCKAIDEGNGLCVPVEYTDQTGTYNINVAMAVASAVHHGEIGATTRKPRVCGLFDCVSHFEVNDAQGPYLTISALDRGDDYEKVGVVIAYVYYDFEEDNNNNNNNNVNHHRDGSQGGDNKDHSVTNKSVKKVQTSCNGRVYKNGDIIKAGDAYPSEVVLYKCYPIIKLIEGWKATPISSKKRARGDPLPKGLCEFISTVEHFTGATVLSIGNGPAGDNLIYLKKSSGNKAPEKEKGVRGRKRGR